MTDFAPAAEPLRQHRFSLRSLVARPPAAPCSFPELVHAHFRWRQALDAQDGLATADAAYRTALAGFERAHGAIVNAYWCSDQESAVALTARRRPWLLGRLRAPALAFHRVSDWATRNQPDIAGQLHRCDEVAVKAANVLTGLRRNICMQLVMASAGHLLSLVDARARHESEDATVTALAVQQDELRRAEHYLKNAANRQAQMIYFTGMGLVAAALLAAGSISWFGLDRRGPLFASLVAGAFGALISVVQRIQSGKFDLEDQDNVGRSYLLFLGGLRPVLGAVFGVVVYAALGSGLIQVGAIDIGRDPTIIVVLAFLSGFNERWASDTLAAAVPAAAASSGAPEPPEA